MCIFRRTKVTNPWRDVLQTFARCMGLTEELAADLPSVERMLWRWKQERDEAVERVAELEAQVKAGGQEP